MPALPFRGTNGVPHNDPLLPSSGSTDSKKPGKHSEEEARGVKPVQIPKKHEGHLPSRACDFGNHLRTSVEDAAPSIWGSALEEVHAEGHSCRHGTGLVEVYFRTSKNQWGGGGDNLSVTRGCRPCNHPPTNGLRTTCLIGKLQSLFNSRDPRLGQRWVSRNGSQLVRVPVTRQASVAFSGRTTEAERQRWSLRSAR